MTDWQVGDLALALGVKRPDHPQGWFPKGCGPRLGSIIRVDGVVVVGGSLGLIFQDFPSPHPTRSWNSRSFGKILPDEHTQCEPEFVQLLKRSKVSA